MEKAKRPINRLARILTAALIGAGAGLILAKLTYDAAQPGAAPAFLHTLFTSFALLMDGLWNLGTAVLGVKANTTLYVILPVYGAIGMTLAKLQREARQPVGQG